MLGVILASAIAPLLASIRDSKDLSSADEDTLKAAVEGFAKSFA